MTLNILSLSVTIKKRTISLKQAVQQEMVKKLYEESHDRLHAMNHWFL
ncbi:YrzI family small protein [Neobacillus niacini]|nr:YrzI family small protein [Neobacillus niacini]MCM3764417.1 YrzI family small protein [Neobacillus niacini]